MRVYIAGPMRGYLMKLVKEIVDFCSIGVSSEVVLIIIMLVVAAVANLHQLAEVKSQLAAMGY